MSDLILDSLEIEGFRTFRHLTVEELGRVNLIVGKNNVGKTALLHTWLAWQEKPNLRIGEAISREVFDPEQPLAERFVDWARRLFLEG